MSTNEVTTSTSEIHGDRSLEGRTVRWVVYMQLSGACLGAIAIKLAGHFLPNPHPVAWLLAAASVCWCISTFLVCPIAAGLLILSRKVTGEYAFILLMLTFGISCSQCVMFIPAIQ